MAAKQRKQSRAEQRKEKNFERERERKRQTGKEKRDRENDSHSSTLFQSQPYSRKDAHSPCSSSPGKVEKEEWRREESISMRRRQRQITLERMRCREKRNHFLGSTYPHFSGLPLLIAHSSSHHSHSNGRPFLIAPSSSHHSSPSLPIFQIKRGK